MPGPNDCPCHGARAAHPTSRCPTHAKYTSLSSSEGAGFGTFFFPAAEDEVSAGWAGLKCFCFASPEGAGFGTFFFPAAEDEVSACWAGLKCFWTR